ncbi:hypothetical protein [Streptomyces liangshanensis]|uniref:Lipoprotein n=1 Tax=Streptomyces liangshanensis TaxID=2717324 RepID=A0A6G9GVQ9_9ACTN|nr:hypothetical protein [Streptomyces liangshanensis]QIQ02363.1 hypothetical protein HA039_08620 [Streptomyces liangshanensis]
MRTHLRRSGVGLAAVAACMAAVVGCSSGGDGASGGGGAGDGGLDGALRAVPASAGGTTVIYVDVRSARDLVKNDNKLYANFASYLVPEFDQFRPESGESLKDVYGFDEGDLTATLTVGDSAQRLTGDFDPDAVSKAFARRDYRAEKTDYGVHLRPGEGRDAKVSEDAVVFGEAENVLSPAPVGGKTVADDPSYRAVSECLGAKVYQASFFGKDKNADATLIAIGGQISEDGTPTETLCVAARSEAAAGNLRSKLREKTAAGERYAGSEVEVTGASLPIVSMTWKNSAKSGMRPADELKILDLPLLLRK